MAAGGGQRQNLSLPVPPSFIHSFIQHSPRSREGPGLHRQLRRSLSRFPHSPASVTRVSEPKHLALSRGVHIIGRGERPHVKLVSNESFNLFAAALPAPTSTVKFSAVTRFSLDFPPFPIPSLPPLVPPKALFSRVLLSSVSGDLHSWSFL